MKSILFIANSISFGGAAKMQCFVAESLAKRGYHVVIANLKISANVTNYERSLNNVVVYTIPPVSSKTNKNIYYVRQVKEIAIKEKSDIVIGFVGYPNMLSAIVGKLLQIPSVISERGDPTRKKTSESITSRIKSRIQWIIINSASGGVFQTTGAQDCYCKRMRKHGVVIPNPIFITGKVPTVSYEERTKTVVSVGRLDNEQKRYDVMLKAFQLFSKSHTDYTLRLYGRGNDEATIKQWCVDLGISEKVQFLGLTTQAMQDIAYDGMFLITSDYEGISNSLLEAMATGLPCVSTDHTPGGARFLITDHKNGLLAPVEDYNSLAKAMSEFADNPSLAKKCGENAKDVIKRFHPDRIIDMWENHIKSVLR